MFVNFNNKIIKTVIKGDKIRVGALGTTSYRNTEQHYYLLKRNLARMKTEDANQAQYSLSPHIKN